MVNAALQKLHGNNSLEGAPVQPIPKGVCSEITERCPTLERLVVSELWERALLKERTRLKELGVPPADAPRLQLGALDAGSGEESSEGWEEESSDDGEGAAVEEG